MSPQEPQVTSGQQSPDYGEPSRAHAILSMPVKMLGKIATRTYRDVKTAFQNTKEKASNATHSDNQHKKQSPDKLSTANIPEDLSEKIDHLKHVVKQSREILAQANNVILPVNLFADTVIVDRTRITIVKRTFFWSSNVISVGIDDILNVSTKVGPFFGSLNISSRVMNSTDHFEIDYFWRNDAIYLKHIIQGYVIAQQNHIATDELTREQLIETLVELGREDHE